MELGYIFMTALAVICLVLVCGFGLILVLSSKQRSADRSDDRQLLFRALDAVERAYHSPRPSDCCGGGQPFFLPTHPDDCS